MRITNDVTPEEAAYFGAVGIAITPRAPRRSAWRWLGPLLALALSAAWWWFFIWAGTRLWRH